MAENEQNPFQLTSTTRLAQLLVCHSTNIASTHVPLAALPGVAFPHCILGTHPTRRRLFRRSTTAYYSFLLVWIIYDPFAYFVVYPRDTG
jgi:uncharacterized membrane protein YraQ (UPF0718 family)